MAGLKDLIGLFNLNDSMTLIYSKDKRKGTLSIGRKSYFSQGKEKKIGYAVQWKLKLQVGLTLKGEIQFSTVWTALPESNPHTFL